MAHGARSRGLLGSSHVDNAYDNEEGAVVPPTDGGVKDGHHVLPRLACYSMTRTHLINYAPAAISTFNVQHTHHSTGSPAGVIRNYLKCVP